ncbi:MAG: TIGR00180 family glycosyltransferase [Candidatus Lokiarchaeota archaeon]|nr:TIGR00180 family glycosyltransferase [Candidatus Lokiarchaeota archaeon]
MNIENLTIVVYTYNRQDFAVRSMRFWACHNAFVLVLDGTAEPIDPSILKEFENKRIQYHHVPGSIQSRFKHAIDIVKTPYVILACDDEFYVPSALEKCMDVLESRPEYVACAGQALAFYKYKNEIRGFPTYPELKNYHITNEACTDRMVAHLQSYAQSSFYAVQRLAAWKNTMRVVSSGGGPFSNPYLLELQVELATVYQGKTLAIDDLLWLRNKSNPPIDNKTHDLKIGHDIWFFDPAYRNERERFFDEMASSLSRINEFNVADIRRALHQSIDAYFKNRGTPSTLRRLIARFLPVMLKRALKGNDPLLKAAQKLEKKGVHVDLSQVKVIGEFLLKYQLE